MKMGKWIFNSYKNILLVLILFALPVSIGFAKEGCCSHHGGVAGCNHATGYENVVMVQPLHPAPVQIPPILNPLIKILKGYYQHSQNHPNHL